MVREDFAVLVKNDVLSRGGLFAMLKAYLDRGAKGTKGAKAVGRVMCVGAALFEPWPYDQFLHRWQPILDEWGATAFHATDFYCGGGEFNRYEIDRKTVIPALFERYRRHSLEIPAIIAEYVHEMFVIAFYEDEYEAVAPKAWRDQFGGVHRVAAQMVASAMGRWANKTSYQGEIAYFYETGDEESASVDAAFRALYDLPDQRKHCRMASTPIGLEKGKARGLEVADCLAWHWNKYAVDTLARSGTRPIRKDAQALMDLMDERGKSIHVTMFAGEALQDFLVAQGCTRRST